MVTAFGDAGDSSVTWVKGDREGGGEKAGRQTQKMPRSQAAEMSSLSFIPLLPKRRRSRRGSVSAHEQIRLLGKQSAGDELAGGSPCGEASGLLASHRHTALSQGVGALLAYFIHILRICSFWIPYPPSGPFPDPGPRRAESSIFFSLAAESLEAPFTTPQATVFEPGLYLL